MKTTKVLPCACLNDYQDQRYGIHKRLHNLGKQSVKPENRLWRCTICEHEKPVNDNDIPKVKTNAPGNPKGVLSK